VQEIERVKRARKDFVTVVPGVRLEDGDTHDQARIGTPSQVAGAGADILVVGRSVSAAPDRRATAKQVHEYVADALAARRV
jgi:orotidine-5'-phosphate decarboxylase